MEHAIVNPKVQNQSLLRPDNDLATAAAHFMVNMKKYASESRKNKADEALNSFARCINEKSYPINTDHLGFYYSLQAGYTSQILLYDINHSWGLMITEHSNGQTSAIRISDRQFFVVTISWNITLDYAMDQAKKTLDILLTKMRLIGEDEEEDDDDIPF